MSTQHWKIHLAVRRDFRGVVTGDETDTAETATAKFKTKLGTHLKDTDVTIESTAHPVKAETVKKLKLGKPGVVPLRSR